MNLVTESWIPVLTARGQPSHISLLAVYQKGQEYKDLAVRPHERVALMRLLLCIAHAALDGPTRKTRQNAVDHLPDAATRYLETWQDSFDLFHKEKPFLQIAGLSTGKNPKKNKPGKVDEKTSKLDFSLATGNASTLFDHHGQDAERPLEPARLALLLLTYQMFSPAGQIGSVKWGETISNRKSNDAPCVVASMLHAFWRGENFLQSLFLNLCSKEQLHTHYSSLGEDWWGRPVWEQMPTSPQDTAAITNATESYLGRLVPISRLVWLDANRPFMFLGADHVYPNYNSSNNPFPVEPSATIELSAKKGKEKKGILVSQPDRAIWRDLHALLMYRKSANETGGGRPGAFLACANVRDEQQKSHDLLVAAVSRDQANIVDALEFVYHIPASMYLDEGRSAYEAGVQQAEMTVRTLGEALKEYAIGGGWQKRLKRSGGANSELLTRLRAKAFVHYWTQVEHHLPLLFACAESWETGENLASAQKAWRKTCFTTALNAYRQCCQAETPRQTKAFALGESVFFKKQTDSNGASGEI